MSPHTLWYTRCPVPTAFSIAVLNGWLDDEFEGEREDVSVRSIAVSTDPTVRQAHFDQSLGSFFRHGGNIPPIVSRSRGTDVRLIGLSWTDTAELVLAGPGTGITSPQDLRGRRLSVPRRVNDGVDFWRATVVRAWEVALDLAGLTADDVEFVDVPVGRTFVGDATRSTERRATLWDARFMLTFQREETAALLRGDVDAIFSHGATAALLPGLTGAAVVVDLGAAGDRALRVNNSVPLALTVTGDLLDERPDLVARVVAQTLRAADWAREHASDATRILAAEVGLPEALLADAYSARATAQLAVDLGPENLAGLQSQIELLHDAGFLGGEVDLDAFVAHEPLAAARELLSSRRPAGV